jgi:hypothetical protein
MTSIMPLNNVNNGYQNDGEKDDFVMPALPESITPIDGYGSVGVVLPEPSKIYLNKEFFWRSFFDIV